MKSLLKLLLLAAVLVSLGSPVSAQDISGRWKGLLATGNIDLRVGLDIKQDAGKYVAKIDVLDQGAMGLPLETFAYADSVMTFSLNKAEYTGRYQPSGTIEGNFVQGGRSMRLNLERGKWEINRPQEPKEPFPYKVEEVTYPNAASSGVTLAGTLTVPEGKGPFPAVVLVSGSGPQDRNEDLLMHKPFWVIADAFARQGIAVLRFDDRGVGKSTGKFSTATSADFATDALAGVEYLRSRSDLPIAKIGITGHSEGGLVAPMAAVQNDKVGFIVLLAGTGVRGDKLLVEQIELISASEGKPEEEMATDRKDSEAMFGIIVKSKSAKQARKKLESYLNQRAKSDTVITKELIKQSISSYNTVWMRYFLKYDPAPTLAKVKCPVLAVNGAKDLQVPSGMNLPAIEAAVKQGGNQDVTVKEFPGLNHLFQHCEKCTIGEYGILEETFSPEVIDFTAKWILEKGR